ncbi:hypothetical protein ACVWZ3_002995 [Bradyrhizobium sp. i1.3.6]
MSDSTRGIQLFHQPVGGGLADGDRDRHGHATLAGRAVACTDQRVDRLVHVSVGHDDGVVLGPAETLAALAGLGCALIDVLRDRRGADEADGLDIGIVEDGVDSFLVAVDDVEDASRQARLDHQLGEHHRHAGVALGRLQDEGVAAGDGRGKLPHRDHRREVERRNARNDAERLAHGIDVDPGAGAFGIFALHQMRDAAGELRDFEAALNVALGIRHGLAMLTREQLGELVVVALHQLDEFHHDAGPALRVGRGPFRLGGTGVLDRGADLGLGRQRHLGLDVAGHRLENVGSAARGALDLLATDEMSD